jgi:hypothetical protein
VPLQKLKKQRLIVQKLQALRDYWPNKYYLLVSLRSNELALKLMENSHEVFKSWENNTQYKEMFEVKKNYAPNISKNDTTWHMIMRLTKLMNQEIEKAKKNQSRILLSNFASTSEHGRVESKSSNEPTSQKQIPHTNYQTNDSALISSNNISNQTQNEKYEHPGNQSSDNSAKANFTNNTDFLTSAEANLTNLPIAFEQSNSSSLPTNTSGSNFSTDISDINKDLKLFKKIDLITPDILNMSDFSNMNETSFALSGKPTCTDISVVPIANFTDLLQPINVKLSLLPKGN